ncbi:MAG: hypothetical protein NTU41_05610, partial [Chloroflexi bacterium]|nr:hypothetical protein [Chloroflexota bacterium]
APQRAIVYLTFLPSNPVASVVGYAPHLEKISESLHRTRLIKGTTADRFQLGGVAVARSKPYGGVQITILGCDQNVRPVPRSQLMALLVESCGKLNHCDGCQMAEECEATWVEGEAGTVG